MFIRKAKSSEAKKAYKLVRNLQKRFVEKLNKLSKDYGNKKKLKEVRWLRDKGKHGGGYRYETTDISLFNTGSVNISQVHYDDLKTKKLGSATAISTIIHPKNPHVPSVHIHISLTELKDGKSYWRIMADLNPSVIHEEDKVAFDNALKELSFDNFEEGTLQGKKYFQIPALGRYRGISHFYLENYSTDDQEADALFAQTFGEGIIDTYINIVDYAINNRTEFSVEDIRKQLVYHTLYLFQVLTLDRGTTSGLLIHKQNDVGIMGSLPKFVHKELLNSWAENVPKPQDELVKNLASVIDEKGYIDVPTKEKLANTVREHYKKYPEALDLQASGNTVPKTVSNHKN